MITPEEEDRLVAQALSLAKDMRDDLGAAHRTVTVLGDEWELRQLCCTLAAMVDPDTPLEKLCWWRDLDRPRWLR